MIKSIIACLAMLLMAGCSYVKVPVGSVGVKVNLYGSDKGVQAQQVGPGRYWLSMNEDVYLFPTFTQTRTWTYDNHEAISFQSKEGMAVASSMGITYHVEPDKVSTLFQTYRKGIDEITDLYIHNMVRDAFVEIASTMPIEDIYGVRKAELVASVQDRVSKQVSPIGLVVEKVYLIGSMSLPEQVEAGINAKIAATQMAERRQNEVAQAEAEARKEVARAQGEAAAKIAIAEAEAKSIKIRADALAQNAKLVEWEAVQKWNGVLPQYTMGGAVPFIQMPNAMSK